MKRWYVGALALLLLALSTVVTYHVKYATNFTDIPNAYAQNLRSEREIFNKVFNLAAARLQTDAWAQPAQPFLTVEEILNKVYDNAGQFLRTSAGGGGSSQAWSDITSGTNVNTLTIGSGGTMTTSGTGINNASQFKGNTVIPVVDGGTGLTSATDDNIPVGNGTIYQLKALPNCIGATSALQYTAATNAFSCGTVSGGGSSGTFDTITSGTNTTATMVVGNGGSLGPQSAVIGVVNANQFKGNSVVAVADGGTNLAAAADDNIMVGNGTTWQTKAVPDCQDVTGNHLNYTASTNTLTCGNSGGTGGTGTFTAITSGTNTTANMVVSTGALITPSGTGIIQATHLGSLTPADVVTPTSVVKLTGKDIVQREVLQVITANATTINIDTTDIAKIPVLTAGVTINVSAGTGTNPEPNQDIEVVFMPTATPQSITWGSSITARNGITLPTSTTGNNSSYDWVKLRWHATVSEFVIIAKTMGVEPGITTLSTSATYTCPHLTSRSCEMVMTGSAGTVTIAIPSGGAPVNGKQLVLKIKCTNAQTITLTTSAGGFIASPNVPITGLTCPAAGPSWTAIAAEYSDVLALWQVYATN